MARGILVLEGLVNLGTGAYAGLFPALFVAGFAAGSAVPTGVVELGRWYAVTVTCLGGLLLYALRVGGRPVLRPLLGFLLIGDILQIAATIAMVRTLGGFGLLSASSLGSSLVFAAARVAVLRDTSNNPESLTKSPP